MPRAVERELILRAAHEPSAGRDRRLWDLARRCDWPTVIELAREHGLIPWLAQVMRQSARATSVTPAEDLATLNMLATASALRSDALFAALARALAALAREGIAPIVLKGPALASTIYPTRDLRPFGDLDLLVRKEELDRADAVLRALAYVPYANGPTELEDFHRVYAAAGRDAVVELHTDLLQLGLPTACGAALWERAERWEMPEWEQPALLLGREHQLLHLCVHLHLHGYRRLIWFIDLARLLRVRGTEVRWDDLWALAHADGVTLSVRHALLLARDLLDAPLPAEALRAARVDPLGELLHGALWPRRSVLTHESKQRLRSLRFNPRVGLMGALPSLLVMGRRREKLARLRERGRPPTPSGAR
ncbi:MAG TPA: nucleotidyltransferase family protein [Ktedonobacterales bacterium]|nr:nucleotidyltransferase family protein [Ktedonobacterales bacterium]